MRQDRESSRKLLVVGGCGGIGARLVERAIEDGYQVTVFDLDRSISNAKLHDHARYVACDVSDEASVDRAFSELQSSNSGLDHLVNLSGYTGERIDAVDMTISQWNAILQTNLTGAFLVARKAGPLLARSAAPKQLPSAVFISSTFGVRVPHKGYAPYAAAKAGVINLVRALATEWAPSVRVNGIAPGAVNTPFLKGGTGRLEKKSGLDVEAFVATVPLRRLGEPDDIVGPILFLLGPDAAYLTGQTLHVNGGGYAP
ncbi:SDR family NAD(P)-dependent oxidoreductase [Pigmentiphaga daeguensis]|jgi:3-oxoacyl-[acyl-carrier protein] reductase|uniref:SDR family oxidoreductase n=1 Tax=Pigmentiphaga daeguensis TaxID=414049 RepID=A0ABN1BS67_9BURK